MASRYSVLHNDILAQPDAQEQLLQAWVLWQRGRGMSDKTITDRLTVIRRIPDAATITPQGVDRFLTSTAWSRATRANHRGAIRAWCKWLIITGRRTDDPTTIATTPKVRKGGKTCSNVRYSSRQRRLLTITGIATLSSDESLALFGRRRRAPASRWAA